MDRQSRNVMGGQVYKRAAGGGHLDQIEIRVRRVQRQHVAGARRHVGPAHEAQFRRRVVERDAARNGEIGAEGGVSIADHQRQLARGVRDVQGVAAVRLDERAGHLRG